MAKEKITESVNEKLTIEFETLEATSINEEKGIYEITLIKEGLTSDKRRYYPKSVLESAVPLFEGTQAYADHPTKSEMKDRPERSIRDLVGIYESARIDNSGGQISVKAQLKTLDSAKWIRPLLNMATESANLCGASIHADGTVVPKGKDGADLVESIKSVFSTDIVTRPNAGGKIERLIASEREEGGEEMKIEELTIEELTKARPELLEAVKKEVLEAKIKEDADKDKKEKPEGDTVDVKEFEALRESNESLKIELKIKESKILDAVKDKEDKAKVEADLTEALKGKSDDEMDKIIESREVFLKGLGVKVKGQPAKEDQTETSYHVGTLLPEARGAYQALNVKETVH